MLKAFGTASVAAILALGGAMRAGADTIPQAVMPAAFVGSPCSPSVGVPTGGKTYYVSPTGNDANNGLSQASAFKTANHAFRIYALKPGDVVLIGPGTYLESITINSAGAPGHCIALMGMPGQDRPVISWSKDSAATINVWAPYIRISGLAVTHPEPRFKANATNNTGNSAIDIYSSLAPDVNGVRRPTTHHVQVDNIVAYGAGCGGISAENTDYLLFYGDTAYGNAFSDPSQCSGISVFEAVAFDDEPGYHIYILDNFSYDNFNIQPAPGHSYTTDGDGIIFDDSRQAQRAAPVPPQLPVPPYGAATLIFGNIVFGNGGGGVHLYSSDNADVVNNVTYKNLNDTKNKNYSIIGGLEANVSGNSVFENNIAIASGPTRVSMHQSGPTADQASNLWVNNIVQVGEIVLGPPNAGNADATRLFGVDPGMIAPSLDPAGADTGFKLKAISAARGVGLPLGISLTDSAGNAVAAGATTNIGAYVK